MKNRDITITVLGIREADIVSHDYDHVISLVHSTPEINRMFLNKFPKGILKSHLHIEFDDVVNHELPLAPKKHQVQHAIEYVRENVKDGEKIIIHCHAGVSRSTAIAIGVLMQVCGLDAYDAYEYVKDIRPQMWPNKLIIGHLDEIYGHGGFLVLHDEEWKITNDGLYWPPQGPHKRG